MTNRIKSAVSAATLKLLHPLARFLLDARIGVGELHTLSKLAYVAVCAERGRSSGGPQRPNIARIAAETGLTRVDVATLLAQREEHSRQSPRGRVRAERVLSGWWEDSAFHDDTGAPARLKLKGSGKSFSALVKRHSGDRQTAPILDELLRAKAVRQLADGRLEAISRTCVNVAWDEDGIGALGEEIQEHLETLLYNLKNPDTPRFARRVTCTRLDAMAARVAIPELAEQAEIFLEGAEDTLKHSRSQQSQTSRPAIKFSVAVQFFQGPVDDSTVPTHARDARDSASRVWRTQRPSRRKTRKSSSEAGDS